MKFTKCVIGPNYTPVGFVYEVNGIERYEDFASLCRRNAEDGKLYFSDSGVFGLYNNTENAIDICRETAGGGYSEPIDPSITLTQRIISGGNIVGFVVKDSTGVETKKHKASILSAAKYMKPSNFMVVERDGNQFLRGKGVSLNSLPALDITPALNTPARPKTVRSEPHDVVDPKLTKGVSLAELTAIVETCEGVILKLPEDKYTPVGSEYTEDGNAFSRLTNVCEIAYPSLEAAGKKLSASYQFKVPGTVLTSEGVVLAYIYRKKNIVNIHYQDGVLRGDKVRLGRVVIALPKEHEQRFYQAVAGTVTVEAMAGTPETVNTAMKLVKMQDPVFVSVDLTSITLLGPEYLNYLLAGDQIKAYVEEVNKHKYVSNLAKKFSSGILTSGGGVNPVFANYANFSPLLLTELSTAGVDIHTGIYTDPNPVKTSNSKAVDKDADTEIEYEYGTKYPSVPRDAAKVMAMTTTDLPTEVIGTGIEVLFDGSITDPVALRKEADALAQKSGNVRNKLERLLFFHKVAMVMDGNNKVHAHDKDEWESASVRANAQFTKYTHTSGLDVKLRQIEMAH